MSDKRLNVAPGDEVILRLHLSPPELHIVSHVTPSGRIKIRVNDRVTWEFNPDGYMRGEYRHRIEMPTPDTRRSIARSMAIRKIQNISFRQWDQLSLETLETIIALANLAEQRVSNE